MKSTFLLLLSILVVFSSLTAELKVMKKHGFFARDSRFIVSISSQVGEKHTLSDSQIENAFKRAFYEKVTALKQNEVKNDDIVFTDSATFRDVMINVTIKNIHFYSKTVMFDVDYTIASDGRSFSDFALYTSDMENSTLPYAEKMASYLSIGAKRFVDDFFTAFIR